MSKVFMGPLRRFFNRIIRFIWCRRASRPEDIPKKLDADALRQAMEEARLLRFGHRVDVRPLAPGEIPGLPRRADDGPPEA